jgi:hypothetical protein
MLNPPPPFTPTRTIAAFAALLKAGPSAPKSLVEKVVLTVMDDARGEDTPDATSTFNVLLKASGCFCLSTFPQIEAAPFRFGGGKREALRAWCLARVLAELCRQTVRVEGGREPRLWGWEAMSSDAQGWCRGLMACTEPRGFRAEAHHALTEAKALIAAIRQPSSVKRLPEARIDENAVDRLNE